MGHYYLNAGLKEYEVSLKKFIDAHDLPRDWFLVADHFAIKCADRIDYENTCKDLSRITRDGVWEIELNGRSLGSAELLNPIKLGENEFAWIEIMQPRPGKETESGFVEHTEFLVPDFKSVQQILDQRNVDYEIQKNPGHKWINIVIDNMEREIKINNKLLADVVKWELQEGHLKKRDDS